MLLIVVWLLVAYVPGWYRPSVVAAADFQAVRDDLGRTVNFINRQMNAGSFFVLRITQPQLNAWLTARAQIWPEAQDWIPSNVEQPFVVFDTDHVRVAGTVRVGGVRTVLSADLHVGVDEQGIAVRLDAIRLGAMHVPDAVVDAVLRRAYERMPDRGAHEPGLDAMRRGMHWPNESTWRNGERPYRIQRITIEPGALTVEVEPLPRYSGSSGRSSH